MQAINATEIRKNWSSVCDDVARVRPSFIKRTHDNLVLSSRETMLQLLAGVKAYIEIFPEEDGSFTAISVDTDLAENAATSALAFEAISEAILDYAEEYYDNFDTYSKAPNRAGHLPIIIKALLLGNAEMIREELVCQNGKI